MEDTSATIDPITGEGSEKTGTESTGQGKDSSQASQEEQDNAGQSQDQTEDGKEQGTETRQRPFRSKNQTIYELRQKLRDQNEQVSSMRAEFQRQIDEIKGLFQPRGQNQKPSRSYYEAPEDTINSILDEKLSKLNEQLLERLEKSRMQDQQSVAWKQETTEAAKFITDQKGLTEDDIADIEELVRSTPEMKPLSPMQRAKYAMFLWKEQKGVADKSALKAKAASVSGAPAGVKAGMTDEDIEREISKFPQDVSKWTPEEHERFKKLEREIIQSKQGKV